MEDRLIFLIGSPRSGTTMLARMLGAHSEIHAPAEAHLMTGLAHLGYFEKVDEAPYDPIITQLGLKELVSQLPKGEDDYVEALRAHTDTLYEKLLANSGKSRLLDKTPAYALVLDFIARLYPKARYVVITRNPMAVWSSQVESFFDGDPEEAQRKSPLLERYVPAIARFVRERPVPLIHVRYEELVADPERHAQEISAHLGLPYQPAMVDYGETAQAEAARGLGDPVQAARAKRPTTDSLDKWKGALAADPGKLDAARASLARVLDADLEAWGYRRAELAAELDAISPRPGRKKKLDRFALERRVLGMLRKNIHKNALGRVVRRIRFVCDVLLR
ncbi:MAG: sulfotransferase [Myxococcales bacterium]|nr:sulfotransferase [Myxococcales bacterium]